MADDTKLEPRSLPSISKPAQTSPVNPLKRKEPPGSSETGQKHFSPAQPLPTNATNAHQGEYEKGYITCEVCRTGVGIRDEETGGFTLKHWEAHRLTCPTPGRSSSDPVTHTSESTAEDLAHPPAPIKRRRAKRTEQERINYLREDPYVAQFEAYRVLCTSCDKWIRLRSRPTYCSIAWDAHRKGCLDNKICKNITRKALSSTVHDIRTFDAEHVLCSICDKWLSVNPDDHRQAVQKWLQRAVCQDSASTFSMNQPILPEPVSVPPFAEQMAVAIGPVCPEPNVNSFRVQPLLPYLLRNHTPVDNPSFHSCNLSTHARTHESWRRNTEKGVATLRTDNLISKVEPNRVFCSLCQEWIQLRQDRPYCAYPWLQHRHKYLERHAADNPSFQLSHPHYEHADHQRDTAIGSIPTVVVENPISDAENTSSHALTLTYNLDLQSLFRNHIQSSYYLDDSAVDSTTQLPTVIPTATNVAHDENINGSAFTNAYTAQGINDRDLAVANHLMPPVCRVENNNTLTNMHDPAVQTLFSGINNVQPSSYPENPAVDSLAQWPTMGFEVHALANYYPPLDETTRKYFPVSDGKTVNWHCNLSGCQYACQSRRDIERHCSNLRHGGCRKHECEHCGKTFMRGDILSRHVKKTHLRQA